jgi:tellurite resistance protein TerC
LYFALAAMLDRFHYLKPSLAFILAFVGIKLVLTHHAPLPLGTSLWVLLSILLVGVLASTLAAQHRHLSHQLPVTTERRFLSTFTLQRIERTFLWVSGATLTLVGAALWLLPQASLRIAPLGALALLLEFTLAKRWLLRLLPGHAGSSAR